ncbi:MAG: esterase-like activity of phytase family protein [Prevotella sp.]|nr:esterase-like activity of phytase family protein [Prevotella sp.]
MKRRLLTLLLFTACTATMTGQHPVTLVRMNRQQQFPRQIPPGNYSGICRLNDSLYAVVNDKSPLEGFHLFDIDIDRTSGVIRRVKDLGFKGDRPADRDEEGIVFRPHAGTILICGEKDQDIIEYDLQGRRTGRKADMPALFRKASTNAGMESLAYQDATRTLWTCTEAPLPEDLLSAPPTPSAGYALRLQAFDDALRPVRQYAYRTDPPLKQQHKAAHYAMGVSELTALEDGSLLVLEREFYVPRRKLGASVRCKLFQVMPAETFAINTDAPLTDATPCLPKRLVCEWKTRIGLFNRGLANYEGMCLGPRLDDGTQTLLLVSDSQNRYGGVLKDWFKVIILR